MSLNEQQLIAVAQAYGIKHWLSSPISGAKRKILEHFWDKYRGHMEVLRDADEAMRMEAGRFDEYLDNAKVAYKQKRYIDVAHWIGQINLGSHRMLQQAQQVADLKLEHLAEQFGQSTEAESDADYFTPPPVESGGFTSTAAMEVEAGMIEDAMRGISGTFLEKMYWRQTQERKIALDRLIKDTSRYIEGLKRMLNVMGHARAQGNLSNWIHEAQKIVPVHQRFQTDFKAKYDKNIRPLVDAVRKSRPKETPVQQEPERTAPKTRVEEPFKSEPKSEIKLEEPEIKPEPKSEIRPETKPKLEPVEEKETEVLRGRPPKETTDWDQLEKLMQKLKEEPSAPSTELPSAPSAEAPKRRGRPPGSGRKSAPPSAPEAAPVPETSVSAPASEVLPGSTDEKLEALKKLVQEQAATETQAVVRRGPGRPRKTPSIIPPPSLAPESSIPAAEKLEPAVAPEVSTTEELAKAVKFNESVKNPIILLSFPPGFDPKNLPAEQLRKITKEVNGRSVFIQPAPEDRADEFKTKFSNRYDEVRVIPVSAVLRFLGKEEPKATVPAETEPAVETPRRGPGRPRKTVPPVAPEVMAPSEIVPDKSIVLLLAPAGVDYGPYAKILKKEYNAEVKRFEYEEDIEKAKKDLEAEGYVVHMKKLVKPPAKSKTAPEAKTTEAPIKPEEMKPTEEAKPVEEAKGKTAVIFITRPGANEAEQAAQIESAKNKAKENDWIFGGQYSDDDSLERMEALEKAGYKVELIEYKEPKSEAVTKPNEPEIKPEAPKAKPAQVGLEGKEKGEQISEEQLDRIKQAWATVLQDHKEIISILSKAGPDQFLGKVKSLPGADIIAQSKRGLNYLSLIFGVSKDSLTKADPIPLTDEEKIALEPYLKDVVKELQPEAKEAKVAISPMQAAIKYTHQRFFNELQKVASKGDKYLMASMMAAYSEKIDEIDPDMSMKLLMRARKIVNV